MEDIKYVYENVDRVTTSEYMSDLLMDDTNSTWKMFEEMAYCYINGSEEYRKGIDDACSVLTGYYFTTIAKRIREDEKAEDDED